tara:strand:- start:1506 stop:1796 length:291 start_codon:yes stop_codon:yes gene_type:complete
MEHTGGVTGEGYSLLADGLEDAFIGYFQRVGKPKVAVYDYEKCLKVLIDRDGMSDSEADEYLQFNTVGAWVGEGTPAFMYKTDIDSFSELCDRESE